MNFFVKGRQKKKGTYRSTHCAEDLCIPSDAHRDDATRKAIPRPGSQVRGQADVDRRVVGNFDNLQKQQHEKKEKEKRKEKKKKRFHKIIYLGHDSIRRVERAREEGLLRGLGEGDRRARDRRDRGKDIDPVLGRGSVLRLMEHDFITGDEGRGAGHGEDCRAHGRV